MALHDCQFRQQVLSQTVFNILQAIAIGMHFCQGNLGEMELKDFFRLIKNELGGGN